MAHFASNKFNYWGQLGVLLAFLGAGLIVGGMASLIPLLGKINLKDFTSGNSSSFVNSLLKPENAEALRWMQFISTLFLFFLPPFFYAWVCHTKSIMHLGFDHSVKIKQAAIVILIMLASLPVVGALQDLTEMLPWSKSMVLKFKLAEDDYDKQVMIMARMNNLWDYIISVIVIALLPAVFEETLFRGGVQNLLSRWLKMPIVAIIITSIIFSAIHGSYLGFLSRAALGFVLGWIYYRTGNIWLNIIGHFFNNALAITGLYISSQPGKPIDISKADEHFPLWLGAVGVALVVFLFMLFEKNSAEDIDRPGEEVLIDDINHYDPNPFDVTTSAGDTDFVI